MSLDIETVLSEPRERIGFCRAGAARGKFIVLDPYTGTDIADDAIEFHVSFSGPFLYEGETFDDALIVSQGTHKFIENLRSFDIEWAPSGISGRLNSAVRSEEIRPSNRERFTLSRPAYGKAITSQALLELASRACTEDRLVPGTFLLGLNEEGFFDVGEVQNASDTLAALMGGLEAYNYALA